MTQDVVTTDNATLQEFASLYREKLDLQEREREINARIAEMQDPLLNYMAETGWDAPPRVLAVHPDTEAYQLLDEAGEALLEYDMERGGPSPLMQRITAALAPKRITLFIHSQLWANQKPDHNEEACEALTANGYAHLVKPTFNVQSLSAVARELEKNGEEFPAAVLEHVQVTNKVEIRGRRA